MKLKYNVAHHSIVYDSDKYPPAVIVVCVWICITPGTILWGCRMHCTQGDRVGGRLRNKVIHQPREEYSSVGMQYRVLEVTTVSGCRRHSTLGI